MLSGIFIPELNTLFSQHRKIVQINRFSV